MDQNHSQVLSPRRGEQIRLSALASRLLVVDGRKLRARIELLAVGEGAQLVVEQQLRQCGLAKPFFARTHAIYGPASCGDWGNFVRIDGDDVVEAWVPSVRPLRQGWQKPIFAGLGFDQFRRSGRLKKLCDQMARALVNAVIKIGACQAPVQCDSWILLDILESLVKEPVKAFACDVLRSIFQQLQNQPGSDMVEVHRHPCIHFLHAQIAKLSRLPPHGHRQDSLHPPACLFVEREKLLQTMDVLESLAEQKSVERMPGDLWIYRRAETDIHVRSLEHQVALDEELRLGLLAQLPSEQFGGLAQYIVACVNRIERDVRGYDQGWLPGSSDQRIGVCQA